MMVKDTHHLEDLPPAELNCQEKEPLGRNHWPRGRSLKLKPHHILKLTSDVELVKLREIVDILAS